MKKKLFFAVLVITTASSLKGQLPSYLPTNGLAGWWPFNGNAQDESGNGNNGSVNGPTLTTDRFGSNNSAYNFSGTNNVITLNNTQNIVSGSFSVSAWFTIEDNLPNNFDATIIGQLSTPINDRKWLFGYRAISGQSGTSNYIFDNQGNMQAFYDTNWFPAVSTWYHVTWVFNAGNSIETYLNGVLHFSQNITLNNFNNAASNVLTRIGNAESINSPNNMPWVGKLDDIGLWNRALTQEEITLLYLGCQLSVNTQPTNQTAATGSTAQFSAGTAEPNATFQWQTNLGLGWQNVSNAGQYSGSTSNTLLISNVTAANNNQAFRCIISSGSCADTSDSALLNVVDNSGIQNFSQAGQLAVFPNPAKDQITVQCAASFIGKTYRITDASGKIAAAGTITDTEQTISLELFPAGIYTLSLVDGISQSFKIIKE